MRNFKVELTSAISWLECGWALSDWLKVSRGYSRRGSAALWPRVCPACRGFSVQIPSTEKEREKHWILLGRKAFRLKTKRNPAWMSICRLAKQTFGFVRSHNCTSQLFSVSSSFFLFGRPCIFTYPGGWVSVDSPDGPRAYEFRTTKDPTQIFLFFFSFGSVKSWPLSLYLHFKWIFLALFLLILFISTWNYVTF